MIFDNQTLSKCSLDQLREFKEQHKKEMYKLLDEWFSTDSILSSRNGDISWHVQACSHRIEKILNAIKNKVEIT